MGVAGRGGDRGRDKEDRGKTLMVRTKRDEEEEERGGT